MSIGRLAAVVCVISLIGTSARAQTLRGVTVDAGNQPVSGVLVTLVDSSSQVVARGLTNERGEFRLAAARAGAYRVRTLRIGFRPMLSNVYALAANSETTTRIVLSNVAVMLDTVRATGKSVCGEFGDPSGATYTVWEQVRAALTATEMASMDDTLETTTVGFDRVEPSNPEAASLAQQTFTVATVSGAGVWRTQSPAALHSAGYAVRERGGITYVAPGIDMLLSTMFIQDHCFKLTNEGAPQGQLGIAFEPTSARGRISEIRGTLWVDRSSSELRRIEFVYTNHRERSGDPGGSLDFVRLRDGTWVITDWSIHRPYAQGRLIGKRVTGGTLALASRRADTLWAPPPLTIQGTMRDSVSGEPIVGARITLDSTSFQATTDSVGHFTLPGLRPGERTFRIHTPSLDSTNAEHTLGAVIADEAAPLDFRVPSGQMVLQALCGRNGLRDVSEGVVTGRLRLRSDSVVVFTGVRVTAEWSVDSTKSGRVRQLTARMLPDGSFRACGVPATKAFTLFAKADGAEMAAPISVTLPPKTRLAQTALVLDTRKDLDALGATFTGTVITDSTRQPIVGAEVALPELGKSTLTDERGDFRLGGIGSGKHRVVIRHIGYGAADTSLTFSGHETVERTVVLGRAVMLEAVQVTASAADHWKANFEEHRRIGLGRFMTREELAKYDGLWISAVLQGFASAWVTETPNGSRYLISRRSGCAAHVYVDGVLMNGSKEPAEPFDLRQVPTETVEAMEYYPGAASTPLEYSRFGSQCGVLVIWTRRG